MITDFAPFVAYEVPLALLDGFEHFQVVISVERQGAREHNKGNDSDGPVFALEAVLFTLEYLWGHKVLLNNVTIELPR